MNKRSPEHQHSPSSGHPHAQEHKHHKAGWKPHRDWRVWTVALMLLAMAVYVLTLNESIWPGGGPAVPAAPAPVDAQ
jgi:anti-sigma-K factor RskA